MKRNAGLGRKRPTVYYDCQGGSARRLLARIRHPDEQRRIDVAVATNGRSVQLHIDNSISFHRSPPNNTGFLRSFMNVSRRCHDADER